MTTPDPIEPRAELFAHGADIGVRGIGATRASAFEQAARALMMAITEPNSIDPRSEIDIACKAPDDGFLLLDWLNALIYEMGVRRLVFGHFKVAIDDGRLNGKAWGEPIDATRHAPAVEPKGATLTELMVKQRADGTWVAQCVVDV